MNLKSDHRLMFLRHYYLKRIDPNNCLQFYICPFRCLVG